MFRDPLECYQAIGSALEAAAREPWETILVEAVLDEDSVNLLITYTPLGGAPAAGNFPYVPMLARHFHDLAGLVSSLEKGFYKVCKFALHNDGRYTSDFIY